MCWKHSTPRIDATEHFISQKPDHVAPNQYIETLFVTVSFPRTYIQRTRTLETKSSILTAVRKCSTPCVSTSSVMLFRKLWYTIRSCCYLWCRAYRRCTQLELFQLERLARGGPHRYKHGNPLVAEGYRDLRPTCVRPIL